MDRKTQELRRRMKAERQNNCDKSTLSSFEARGKGRANRRHETFPATQCEYRPGAKLAPIRRRRKKDDSTYIVMLVVGGLRCTKTADVKNARGHRCLEHASAEYEGGKKEKRQIEGSPRSGM